MRGLWSPLAGFRMRHRTPFMRNHPRMTGDPLNDVLSLVEARSIVTGGIFGGGSWAIRFPPPRQIKLYAVAKGAAWMVWEGEKRSLRLEAGDVVLIAERAPFLLASDFGARPQDVMDLAATAKDGFLSVGQGEEFLLIGGHVTIDPVRGGLLLDALPPHVHVRGATPEAMAIGQLIPQLAKEVREERVGKGMATGLLTQLIFLHVLRAHLAADSPSRGWLRALADPRIAPVIHKIHARPSYPWSLNELADIASMSRSSFALRFKAVAGIAPLTYVTEWRMRLAERALREEEIGVATLAYSLGYSSESAFSNAFKRVIGVAPKHYRRGVRG